jgi:predicted nuclease of restriction endonuclease-like (RecB) superfamily
MKKKLLDKSYLGFIAEIKQSIIKSRYQAASLANREQLLLYLYIGKRLSVKIEAEKWGAKIIEQISKDLQAELPGLRGFSERNLNKMRQFYAAYSTLLIMPLVTAQLGEIGNNQFMPLPTAQLEILLNNSSKKAIRPLLTAQMKSPITSNKKDKKFTLNKEHLNNFFRISFTHHISLLNKCENIQERFFYIQMATAEMLSVDAMEHHIKADAHKKLGKLPNNFKHTLPANVRSTALNVFKDAYLFDFMSLDDSEEERVFEDAAVANIRKFIMSLGKGFSFIGNQYKIEIEENEFFIDLLFYNRILQCLVAFELKRGKFKPEYAGKLNFYLNVLDDKVKLPHEKPSIGIILCKEKNNTEVEYSFKNINKAMGVATYKLSTEVPKEMKGILPNADELKRLL